MRTHQGVTYDQRRARAVAAAAIREAALIKNHPPDLINVALERLGVTLGKVADFAGEAAAQDIDTLSQYEETKRLALVACLVHTVRMQARDDLAEMLCKRVAAILKKASTELEEIRLRQRVVSEQLIGTYRAVLEHLDPDGETAGQALGQGPARAVAAVQEDGGFAAQLADIEEVSAFHGDYPRHL